MPAAPIPFTNQQASGLAELSGASPIALNVVTEPSGAVRRRPGIVALPGMYDGVVDSRGLDGVFVAQTGELYAVASPGGVRQLYRIGVGGAVALTLSTDSETALTGTLRPVFAETEALLVIAAGKHLQKVDLKTHGLARLGGSPPEASHVIANAARLLANDLADGMRGFVQYSGQALGSSIVGHEHWMGDGVIDSTEGYFQAEGRPDPVVALAENTNEVFAFGRNSVQVFLPDAIGVYAPSVQRESGCIAPYSIVKVDHAFAWLDQRRRFVLGDGREHNVISDPIQQTLDAMPEVSDCFGYRVVMGPVDCMVWTFPIDGRTFVFQKGAGWAQWHGQSGGELTRFAATCMCHNDATGRQVIGTRQGKVGTLSLASAGDLGETFKASVTTGYINRDTDQLKHTSSVRLSLRRGHASSGSGEVGWLRWRDRPGPWRRAPVRLGRPGDSEPVVRLFSLGVYRRRQWQFEFAGQDEIVLAGAEEEFEILGA